MGLRIGGHVGPVSASTGVRVRPKTFGLFVLGVLVIGLLVLAWPLAIAVGVIGLAMFLVKRYPALSARNLLRRR